MGRGSKHGHGSKHNHTAKAAKAAGGGGCCGGGKHAGKGKHQLSPAVRPERQLGGPPEKDTDPVCGMEISTKTAKPSFHDGLVYYFCSTTCRETFEASPLKYLGGNTATEAPGLKH